MNINIQAQSTGVVFDLVKKVFIDAKNWFFLGMIATVLTSNLSLAAVDDSDPQKLVKTLFNSVIDELELNREEYQKDNDKLNDYAKKTILPYFDTKRMGKFILGRELWKSITEKQQNGFISALSELIINSYSNSLLGLEISKIEVKAPEFSHKNRVAKIPLTAYQKQKSKGIELLIHLILNVNGVWKVYDASIDGITILVSFRKTYTPELDKKGIDVVTQEMLDKIVAIKAKQKTSTQAKQDK